MGWLWGGLAGDLRGVGLRGGWLDGRGARRKASSVIESLLGEDRRAEALARYRYCAELLTRELGIRPSTETALVGRKVR